MAKLPKLPGALSPMPSSIPKAKATVPGAFPTIKSAALPTSKVIRATRGTKPTRPTKIPRKPKLNITKPTFMTAATNTRKKRPPL